MTRIGILFLSGLALPNLVAAQTVVTQLGQSGKFRISRSSGEDDPNAVTVEPDFIGEVLTNGDYSDTHQNPTLANQDFSIEGEILSKSSLCTS